MTDPGRLAFLQDCDNYLMRQQALLDQLAIRDAAPDLGVAMEAAFDQFARAVADQWRALAPSADDPVAGGPAAEESRRD